MTTEGQSSGAAGYSGTPLARKLGLRPGMTVQLVDAPDGLLELLAPLPMPLHFSARLGAGVDLVCIFSRERRQLDERLQRCRRRLGPQAVVWACWPKKASKVPTDITEDVVRALALPLGFVDIKVCAVDATWSALKLVVRKALR